MPFSSLMKDKVCILKSNGDVFKDIQASVQTKNTFIQRSDILIETDDLIQRSMSNGSTETYRVIDPGFHEGLGGIPAGYQISHKNLGLPEAEKAIQSITYNLIGNNTRVNNDSTDNSINVVNINNDIADHISMLKDEIRNSIESTEKQDEAYEIIDAIEGQFESSKPSKAVLSTLINTLPNTGSIASIGSFLLSCVGG